MVRIQVTMLLEREEKVVFQKLSNISQSRHLSSPFSRATAALMAYLLKAKKSVVTNLCRDQKIFGLIMNALNDCYFSPKTVFILGS